MVINASIRYFLFQFYFLFQLTTKQTTEIINKLLFPQVFDIGWKHILRINSRYSFNGRKQVLVIKDAKVSV